MKREYDSRVVKYKDKSIFSKDAIVRGYDLGKRTVKIFRDCMEVGHSVDLFLSLYEAEAKKTAQFGLVSPVGELFGLLRHPIYFFKGIGYYSKNSAKRRY